MKEEPYENNVGFSERADVPIEPRLSEQWFLKYPERRSSRATCVARAAQMQFLSRALGEGLRSLDGEHSGLVHQPAALVGASHSGVDVIANNAERRSTTLDGNDQEWCISRQLGRGIAFG